MCYRNQKSVLVLSLPQTVSSSICCSSLPAGPLRNCRWALGYQQEGYSGMHLQLFVAVFFPLSQFLHFRPHCTALAAAARATSPPQTVTTRLRSPTQTSTVLIEDSSIMTTNIAWVQTRGSDYKIQAYLSHSVFVCHAAYLSHAVFVCHAVFVVCRRAVVYLVTLAVKYPTARVKCPTY